MTRNCFCTAGGLHAQAAHWATGTYNPQQPEDGRMHVHIRHADMCAKYAAVFIGRITGLVLPFVCLSVAYKLLYLWNKIGLA